MKQPTKNKIMEKQKIFKSKYVKRLKENLKSRHSIHLYSEQIFPFDDDETLVLSTIYKPKDLLKKMNPDNDLDSAIAIYEGYRELTLLQASDERFWTYLTHVDLYQYMIKRWNAHIEGKAKNPEKYIREHWFLLSESQQSLMRHPLSGLWWGVHLSIDEERNDKYELTKILFRQLDFATRTLPTYRLGRHKEAIIGILEFIKNNDELFRNYFEDKTRFVTRYLNLIGGTVNLAYVDRTFFIGKLNRVKEKIKQIGSR